MTPKNKEYTTATEEFSGYLAVWIILGVITCFIVGFLVGWLL